MRTKLTLRSIDVTLQIMFEDFFLKYGWRWSGRNLVSTEWRYKPYGDLNHWFIVILRYGPVDWPPKLCDLTSLDYYLWGYLKSLVYADKSATINDLEANILRVICDTQPQLLDKLIEKSMYWKVNPCIDLSNKKNIFKNLLFVIYFLNLKFSQT